MRTAVAETSLETYRWMTIPDLQRKEREVLDLFRTFPDLTATRERLAWMLGWKEASVCGRVNSLIARKALEEIEGGMTNSGRSAKLVRVPVVIEG